MTEPEGPRIPPKPPLPPRELQRERARQARRQELEEKRRLKAEERSRLEREEAEGLAYHGHHVVDREELDAVFEEPTAEQVKVRRRWTHGIILSLLGGIVVIALALAFLVWTGVLRFPQAAPASPTTSAAADPNCPADNFDYPANIGITVNVYNTTTRAGLAGGLATELKARGYQVNTVGDKTISTTSAGVVVSGLMGESAAFNLQRNIPGLEFRRDDRADASVDMYLAAGYQAPIPADKVDSTPGKISCAKPSATSGN